MSLPDEFMSLPLIQAIMEAGRRTGYQIFASQIISELHDMWVSGNTEFNFQNRDINRMGTWARMPQGEEYWREAHSFLFSQPWAPEAYKRALRRVNEFNQTPRIPHNRM